MVKPSQFEFLPPDPGIAAVAWWGERLMAWIILFNLILVRQSTAAYERAGTSDFTIAMVNVAAAIYVLVLFTIAAKPTRIAHTLGIPLGVFTYGAHAAVFIQLFLQDQIGRGNISERVMLTASTIVFHTWGIWSDRRSINRNFPDSTTSG